MTKIFIDSAFILRYTTCKDGGKDKKEGDVLQWSRTQFTGAGNIVIQFNQI